MHIFSFHSLSQIHDDLEKEPEYSGSGFGPDDEDSTTNQRNKPTSHHTNSGNSGFKPTNSKTKIQEPTSTATNKHHIHHKTHTDDDDEFETGSGDNGDKIDDNEDDDDDDLDESDHTEEEEEHPRKTIGVVQSKPKDYNIDEDDDDLTTEIKQTDIDPTTTTDDDDDLGRQLHGFYFYLICFYFSFTYSY